MDNGAVRQEDHAAMSMADSTAQAGSAEDFNLQEYHDLTRIIERLHRRFLDVLRTELARMEINDINAVQCLLLSNIGEEEINVRNLMEKGYYLGSNASYNIKKLVEAEYLIQERSPHDRRSTILKLSDKGLLLCRAIRKAEDELANRMLAFNIDLQSALSALRQVERYWADHIRYGT
jgi:DNA-binding MarR family transcriptional regulator